MITRCTLTAALTFLLLSMPIAASAQQRDLGLSGLGPVERALLAAQTDNEEPPPPAGEATPPATPTPTTGGSEEPGGTGTDEPGGTSKEEPATPSAPGEGEPPAPVVTEAPRTVLHGAGMHLRGLFVPTWFLNMFLDASTPLNSVGFGGEYIRRKGNFDIVASVNFGFYSPEDGNYLGNGKSPAIDTDYIQFRDLNVLAFDVAFIGHHFFLPWLSLVYGAGLGFGIVLGDIYRISNYQSNCASDNLDDFGKCNPVNPADTSSLKKWNEDRDGWLADAPKCETKDSPTAPCQFREDDVWPVVPIVHLLIGVNFKINEQFSVRVDGGFHNAFYFGAAGHYFF
jgi:hypothetical protein